MSDIKLPQNDDRQKRATDLAKAGSAYKYNNDIGLPLIDTAGPDDRNLPDWTLKTFALLLKLRTNVQAIYDKSGLKFQEPKPVRDIPKLIQVLKSLSTGTKITREVLHYQKLRRYGIPTRPLPITFSPAQIQTSWRGVGWSQGLRISISHQSI